ncbi:CaiB/BaiF CoA transferase family protein [Xanthobacteraceae bacterium A53D]
MAPLNGIRMLDLTHMLSGPYGTMLLTDLGVDTIKVEPPGKGEGTRQLLSDSADYARHGMGAYFLTLNRGKRSVCIDLKSAEGREVFLDLVRVCDIVFDNFSVGVPQRLGIGHEQLAEVNPRIITCSVSGFGGHGPDPHRPAFDQVVQAMGGGMSITGLPGGPPIRAGIPIGDLAGGIFGAMGVLAALSERDRTGRGRHVDVSMLDAQISMLNYMATMYLMSGNVPEAMGNGHFVHVPYNTFQCADGYIIIACIGDAFFQSFLTVLPHPDLQRPDYATQPGRYAAKAEIEAVIAQELRKDTAANWLKRLREARVPCGPVNDFAQALADPQVLARDMVVDVALRQGGSVRMPGSPIKFSHSGPDHFGPPPELGHDTDAVLGTLAGYAPQRIDALRQSGAIG